MMLLLLINGRPTSIAYCEVCAPYGQKYWHELTLTVGEVKLVPPNLIPSAFSICIKNSRHLHTLHVFNRTMCPQVCKINQFTKGVRWPVCEGFIVRWAETVTSLCIEYSVNPPKIESAIHYNNYALPVSCILHELPFIRWCMYFTIDYRGA